MNTLTTVGLKHLKDILLDNKIGDVAMESNEEIISRLKFIGYIKKDEKINVKYVNRQPNNWHTTLSRSLLYPDNRNNALEFVRKVIARTFEIIEHHLRKQNIHRCRSIVADLIRSKQGLLNLRYTYSDDTKFCCDLDVLIERVVSQISILRKEQSVLFEDFEVEEDGKEET
jgi:hypothetical protein